MAGSPWLGITMVGNGVRHKRCGQIKAGGK